MNTLPFTYKLLVYCLLPKNSHLHVLDLGCGLGVAGEHFNKKKKHSFTGVDIFKPYATKVKESGYYDEVVVSDLMRYKIKPHTYDVILIFQVLEHLTKKEGVKLLERSIKNARRRVIISIPNGECSQDEYDKNPYQKHKSEWSVNDFKKLGMEVHGQGLKFVYGGKTYAHGEKVALWQKVSFIFSFLLLPVLYFFPGFGAQLICVKYNKQ